MPTPDASQFTRQVKYSAIQDRKITGGPKLNTHLYSYVPQVTMLREFTPSFTNKFTTGLRFVKLNVPTGTQIKTKIPSRGI
jgi:hypothetical protein